MWRKNMKVRKIVGFILPAALTAQEVWFYLTQW